MDTPTLDEIEAQIRTLCGASPTQDGYVHGDVEAACNIALALVAHVRAMNAGDSTRLVIVAEHTKRIAALEAKVAALSAADDVGRAAARAESATSPRMAQKAWAPVAEELERLRAENAELRKQNEWMVKTQREPQWPAQQPIETAPLERILAWNQQGSRWWIESPEVDDTLEKWRGRLKKRGHSTWVHMPLPGGAK